VTNEADDSNITRRWAHVQGVAAHARSLAAVLGADAELLEAAAWRGLAYVLREEFEPAPIPLADALTFCDMTTRPDGEPVPVDRRLAEVHDRYGEGHLVSRSICRATPMIIDAVDHVHARKALLAE
jgi:siderophore synthetase component